MNTQPLLLTYTPAAKKRGRPAKHADAAARQRAFRERNKVVTIRLTGKSAGTVAELAEMFDMSQCEVINQMIKFASANRDWKKMGMTSFAHPDARKGPRTAA